MVRKRNADMLAAEASDADDTNEISPDTSGPPHKKRPIVLDSEEEELDDALGNAFMADEDDEIDGEHLALTKSMTLLLLPLFR